MYQENIMTYLGWLGIEQTETYAIIKKISKKKFKEKELAELKAKLIQSWKEHTGTEEGFDKTWEIMEAFSKYAFNASHAYSYAYDSVYGAYLKAHYPYEFYSVMMQHLSEKGDKDKVTEYKKEMINLGIKNGDYKFRLDNREFSADKKNGSINPSLLSIKHFSRKSADILYELGQQQYDSFSDLLVALRNNGLSEARIQDLIKMDYFSEFGNVNYLERYFEVFSQFYALNTKKYLSQYGKAKAFENRIDYDILRRNCTKETVKTFLGLNVKKIINEIMDGCKDIKTTSKETLQYRYEILGYMDVIDKRYKGFCMAVDLNCDYAPRIDLYALANGNTIPVKISKKKYKENPIKKGDIIKVLSQDKLPKKKKINGEWTELEEKEWWITDYIIC
jgi:DNA polymerase III alpha subunit